MPEMNYYLRAMSRYTDLVRQIQRQDHIHGDWSEGEIRIAFDATSAISDVLYPCYYCGHPTLVTVLRPTGRIRWDGCKEGVYSGD